MSQKPPGRASYRIVKRHQMTPLWQIDTHRQTERQTDTVQ